MSGQIDGQSVFLACVPLLFPSINLSLRTRGTMGPAILRYHDGFYHLPLSNLPAPVCPNANAQIGTGNRSNAHAPTASRHQTRDEAQENTDGDIQRQMPSTTATAHNCRSGESNHCGEPNQEIDQVQEEYPGDASNAIGQDEKVDADQNTPSATGHNDK